MQIEDITQKIQATEFEAEILPNFTILQPKSQQPLPKQSRVERPTCADYANLIEKTLQNLPSLKRHPVESTNSLGEIKYVPSAINKGNIFQTIKDGGFQTAFLQNDRQTKNSLCLTGLHIEKDGDILLHLLKKIFAAV